MDASFFCFVVRELADTIRGLRIEKVFAPLAQCWTFALGRAGYLVVHAGKPHPFLFLTMHKPENPPNPSGQAMWLRKRLRDRRILDVASDWPRRRMALQLSSGEGAWLVVTLDQAPVLADALPDDFGLEPVWPDLNDILTQTDIWKTHPHITSPLRHFLARLPDDDARMFLDTLQKEAVQTFYVGLDHKGSPQVRLWPLEQSRSFTNALEASEHWGQMLLADFFQQRSGEDVARIRACRRLERNLGRLDEDLVRLERMAKGREDGVSLQGILHTLDKNRRLAQVEVDDGKGATRTLKLDPGLTVRENMSRLFARAAKGERGQLMVAARRVALEQELETIRQNGAPQISLVVSSSRVSTPPVPTASAIPAKYRSIKVGTFRSSDGFLIFRGRSAQANHQLLTRAASPFDLWLHAQGGPGAHVIIKKDFPKQDVPEKTLEEAASLAALSSHLKMAGRGDVLVCLVRDVRTIKGAALGMVEVGKVFRTLRVSIQPELEDLLRIAP